MILRKSAAFTPADQTLISAGRKWPLRVVMPSWLTLTTLSLVWIWMPSFFSSFSVASESRSGRLGRTRDAASIRLISTSR